MTATSWLQRAALVLSIAMAAPLLGSYMARPDPAAVEARLAGGDEPSSIYDPSTGSFDAARALVVGRALPAELHDLLVRRTAQAIDHGGRRQGSRYLDLVDRVAAGDDVLLTRVQQTARALAAREQLEASNELADELGL